MLSLVTGGSGLLGGCLMSRLLVEDARLRMIDLVPPGDGLGEATARVEFRRGDMRDLAFVTAACRGVDTVYHLAALQRMKASGRHLSEGAIFAANVAATEHVLAAALETGVRKVVVVSSSGVYGLPRRLPVAEDHPFGPLGSYGRSKVRSEALCREYAARGLDVTMLRPVSLFGPGMTGVFLLLFEWVRRGAPVWLLGSGENRVEMASAWDVAEACRLAAIRPESRGEALNVGSAGVPTTRAQVEALITHAGSSSRIVHLSAPVVRTVARALHAVGLSPLVPEHYLLADREFILDCSRARRVLGWTPRYDNVRMTMEAYDWYVRTWPAARPDPHPLLRLAERLGGSA